MKTSHLELRSAAYATSAPNCPDKGTEPAPIAGTLGFTPSPSGIGPVRAPIEAVEVMCGKQESSCRCVLVLGHEPPHACAPYPECGGKWTYDAEGNFEPVEFPHGLGVQLLFGGLL
jgi:hypothetical protein